MTSSVSDLVAVVRAGPGLGELCLAVPAIRALRDGRPDHHLVLLVPDELVPLAEAASLADAVVAVGATAPPRGTWPAARWRLTWPATRAGACARWGPTC